MVQTPENPSASGPASMPADRDQLRREITENIRHLQNLSNRGLWAMATFLVICLGAWYDFSFLPSLPDHIRAALGKPPPTLMISAALALYTFSGVILTLARIMSGSEKYSGFSHVGFLSGFIFFYHFAHALEENYWAILVAGLTILALESYHIWNYCKEAIARERETLAELERKGKFLES
jgi:hypothetical protein